MTAESLRLAVVGPCAAGKSTLIEGLQQHGYEARHVAQEHSYVPAMWKLLASPDVLIYLDVSYQVSKQRTDSSWQEKIFNKQLERLSHAREHADLIINTDQLSPQEVLDQVLDYLGGVNHE
jgi:thymidylate kinase